MTRRPLCSYILTGILTSVYVATTTAAEIVAAGSTNFGPGICTGTSSQVDREPNPPGSAFTRSWVRVNEVGAGYEYAASSDIGLLELKVYGQLDKTEDDIECGVVNAQARLNDVVTLQSDSPDNYDVTMTLDIDGTITIMNGNARGGASIAFGEVGTLRARDFGSYATGGAVSDQLSVTRTFNGDVDVNITASLFFTISEVLAGGFVEGRLDNTASLRLHLPPGVTIHDSESGTFNVVITPIPIPASLLLFAPGLFALGLLRPSRCWRRRGF